MTAMRGGAGFVHPKFPAASERSSNAVAVNTIDEGGRWTRRRTAKAQAESDNDTAIAKVIGASRTRWKCDMLGCASATQMACPARGGVKQSYPMTMRAARSTTILSVRRGDSVALGGDGQVTLGNVVAKADAIKIRRIGGGKVLVGFAGSAADAFALLERL